MKIRSAHEKALDLYIRAKDQNRPFLLTEAFVDQARFDLQLSEDIEFGRRAAGQRPETVAETVAVIGAQFLDVFTTTVTESVVDASNSLACHWLAGLVGREEEQLFVNWGRYLFSFGPESRVRRLQVSFDGGTVLPAGSQAQTLSWLSQLPSPLCSAKELLTGIPELEALEPLRGFVGHSGT